MDRVLITGGNGFIGSHLAELLLDQGDDVTLFDTHFNSNTAHLSCTKIRGDVRHYSRIKQAVVGQDAVFHFAAVSRVAWGQLDPYACWRTNQLGTLNVLEACRKAKSSPMLFYASSREVYGEPKYFPVDEAHPKMPLSIYGMTKLCAERACRSYADPSLSRPIKSVIFRFSTVYGGEQVLDFTFIDDTIQGILRAYAASMDGGKDLLGQEFHFVTGRGVSVSDLAGMIVELTDSSAQIIPGPANNFDVR